MCGTCPAQREAFAFNADSRGVSTVAYAPDGKVIAVAGYDGTVKFWQAGSHDKVQTLVLPKPKNRVFAFITDAMAFTPEGNFVTACSSLGLSVWNSTTLEEKARLDTGNTTFSGVVVSMSNDGQTTVAASTGDGILLWRLGDRVCSVAPYGPMLAALEITADRKHICGVGTDGNILLESYFRHRVQDGRQRDKGRSRINSARSRKGGTAAICPR
jgi:hypothetical protein